MSGGNSKKLASKEDVPTRYFRNIDVKKLLTTFSIREQGSASRVKRKGKYFLVQILKVFGAIGEKKYFLVQILKVFGAIGDEKYFLVQILKIFGAFGEEKYFMVQILKIFGAFGDENILWFKSLKYSVSSVKKIFHG